MERRRFNTFILQLQHCVITTRWGIDTCNAYGITKIDERNAQLVNAIMENNLGS